MTNKSILFIKKKKKIQSFRLHWFDFIFADTLITGIIELDKDNSNLNTLQLGTNIIQL